MADMPISTWQNGAALASWLGMGTLFTNAAMRWSGENIVARITDRASQSPLTADELRHLDAWRDGSRDGWRRRGTLVTESGVNVAVITAVYLPGRIPDPEVLQQLRCTDTPLGLALRPLMVCRHTLMVEMRACGPWAVEACGVLRRPDGVPVALATEQVYRSFAAREQPACPVSA